MIKRLLMLAILFFLLISLFAFASVMRKTLASTTSIFTIMASEDDGWSERDDVGWDDDGYYLSSNNVIVGCRWRIDIPKGSLILHAYFQCRAKSNSESTNTMVRIQVFDQDSCDDFDEIFWDWPVMEEYVDWPLPSFSQGVWYTSPDIKSLIQSYINRTGYKSGNFIGLRFKLQSGAPAGHEIWSWDGDAESAPKLEITYVPPQFLAPVATFTYIPSNPVVNETIRFDASESYDPDGYIVTYRWNFGDENITSTTNRSVSHLYSKPGEYNVTLSVIDNDGENSSVWQIIRVDLHDIAITYVDIPEKEIQRGKLVNITVFVKNEGTTTESFNVTILSNETIIERYIITDLPPKAEKTLIFQWNTSNLLGNTTLVIRAEASVVKKEYDVEDNTYIAGIIKIVEVRSDLPPTSQLDLRWMFIAIPLAILVATGIIWRNKRKQKFRGFDFFDEITGGGIPDSFSVLIIGGPGAGKSILCQQLNYKFLNMKKPCIYVTYDCFPNEIRQNMKSFHWDLSSYEKEGKFVFIDCFSPIAKVNSEEKFYVNQPFSLSELGIVMSKAVNEIGGSPRIFLDSIVPLLTQIDPQKVIEFLQTRCARIKGINGTFIFTLGKETIKPDLINRLEEVVDCVIELNIKTSGGKVKRKIRVKKMRGKKVSEDWVQFDIMPGKGIVFPI